MSSYDLVTDFMLYAVLDMSSGTLLQSPGNWFR